MRNPFFCLIVYSLSIVPLGCRSPSSDWNGTWKLDPSKSNFQGPTFTIAVSADRQYRWDNGNSSFTFRCDGKDQQIETNRTRNCVRVSNIELDLIQKENGIRMSEFRWELSAGGSLFTSVATRFGPNGPVVTDQLHASRVSGSNDFAGEWRDTTYLAEHSEMTLRLDSRTLYIDYPRAEQYIDAPLNGVEVPVQGPHAPAETTRAVRSSGRREFRILSKRNGRVLTEGSLELSNDGKTITDSWWNPDRPNDKGTLVYEKQEK